MMIEFLANEGKEEEEEERRLSYEKGIRYERLTNTCT